MKTIQEIRNDFPFLRKHPELTYLDSAATALKPDCVFAAIKEFYYDHPVNIHRSTNFLAEKATLAYEESRKKVAAFINADAPEIIFTPNATYAFNMLAGMMNLGKRDGVIGSVADHHSNILPWSSSAKYHPLPIDDEGEIMLNEISEQAAATAKVLVINYASNVTGRVQLIDKMVQWARDRNLLTVVDASQAICHLPVDVKALGVDFLIFSGHKMLGPSGVGVLYGQMSHLTQLRPFFLGGGMAQKVSQKQVVYKPIPQRYEPGTPNIENVIALGAAVDYLEAIGWESIISHQHQLRNYFIDQVVHLKDLQLLAECYCNDHLPIFSFYPKVGTLDIHHLARILSDRYGIILTAGKQCAHPYYEFRRMSQGTVRASFSLYNNLQDVDRLMEALADLTMFLPILSPMATYPLTMQQ